MSLKYKGELAVSVNDEACKFHPQTETSQIVDWNEYLDKYFKNNTLYIDGDLTVTGNMILQGDNYLRHSLPPSPYTSWSRFAQNYIPNYTTLTNIDDYIQYDTSNVTNMQYAFSGCKAVTNMNVSHLNTENVTIADQMFYQCSALTSLDLSHLNLSKVTSIPNMFSYCSALSEITLWETPITVTSLQEMFYACRKLTHIELPVINIPTARIDSMFRNCFKLETIDLTNINITSTEVVSGIRDVFRGCTSLKEVILPGGENPPTNNVVRLGNSASQWFQDCSELRRIAGKIVVYSTLNVDNMFSGCAKLTDLDLKIALSFGNTVSIRSMFNGCSSLTSIPFKQDTVISISSAAYAFKNCSSLVSLNNAIFDLSRISNTAGVQDMFLNCTALDNPENTVKFTNVKTSVFTDEATFRSTIGLNNATLDITWID